MCRGRRVRSQLAYGSVAERTQEIAAIDAPAGSGEFEQRDQRNDEKQFHVSHTSRTTVVRDRCRGLVSGQVVAEPFWRIGASAPIRRGATRVGKEAA